MAAPQQSPLMTALLQRQQSQGLPGTPYNYGDLLGPIQTEIGRQQQQGTQAVGDFLSARQGYGQQLQSDLTNQMNAGLTASVPGIEDRLQGLGLLQSGAYPEALARQKANLLSSSILPAVTAFDTSTFDTASSLPLQQLQQQQGLQTGSIGRQFGQQDIAQQQAFQQGIADKQAQQAQLSSLLGILPALMGSGGLFGGSGGGLGGLGSGAGGQGGGGILGNALGGLAGQGGGLGGVLAGGGLGALGSAIGGNLGGGTGAGLGGALGGLLSGGGLTGALGGGLGGAFGGPLGGAIGGGLGSYLNPIAMTGLGSIGSSISDWWNQPSLSDMGSLMDTGSTADTADLLAQLGYGG